MQYSYIGIEAVINAMKYIWNSTHTIPSTSELRYKCKYQVQVNYSTNARPITSELQYKWNTKYVQYSTNAIPSTSELQNKCNTIQYQS